MLFRSPILSSFRVSLLQGCPPVTELVFHPKSLSPFLPPSTTATASLTRPPAQHSSASSRYLHSLCRQQTGATTSPTRHDVPDTVFLHSSFRSLAFSLPPSSSLARAGADDHANTHHGSSSPTQRACVDDTLLTPLQPSNVVIAVVVVVVIIVIACCYCCCCYCCCCCCCCCCCWCC